MDKRILITGANGLLGCHLYKRLAAQGNLLFCLDWHFTKNPSIPESARIYHDIQFPLPKLKVDWVFNLAGTPSPSRHRAMPIYTGKTSTIGVYNVLDFAVETKAKVFQASTIDVTVSFDPQNANSCYQEGKRMSESIFYDYQRTYGLDVRVARMGNFYGPGCCLEDEHVIPTFIRKALIGMDIVVVGDGNQLRNFCYVEDMVDYILMLMESNFTHPVYAIGRDNTSIKNLAELIIKMTNSKSKILFTNQIELRERRVWSDSIHQLFEWEPKVRLEEGLEKTIKYFREGGYGQEAKENTVYTGVGQLGTKYLRHNVSVDVPLCEED